MFSIYSTHGIIPQPGYRQRMKVKYLHNWNITPKLAIEIQYELQKRISFKNSPNKVHLIAGADASFSKAKELIHGAVSIFSFPEMELIESKTATLPLSFPYIPGLLSFREGPVLLECFRQIKNIPDIILFDGQGIMHPRKMGIATHLGILLDKSTIGCAKSYLYGEFMPPANSKGSFEYVRDKNKKIIGACLRTRKDVKPIFVSIGNKISLSKASDIVLRCTKKYRIPELLRYAHRFAGEVK